MKHWHYRKGSLRPMHHIHEGGGRKHEHAGFIGYGQTKNSLRVEYGRLSGRQKKAVDSMKGTKSLAGQIVGYGLITRSIDILKP